jgi:hypothetical protein
VTTALVARREELLKQLRNAGFDKQLELTDQRLRLCDVTKEAAALKARVQAALALGSDQRCVTAYVEVMTSLSALDANVVTKVDGAAAAAAVLVVSPLEAVTVSASLTARVDVSALMAAVGQWGHVEVHIFVLFTFVLST